MARARAGTLTRCDNPFTSTPKFPLSSPQALYDVRQQIAVKSFCKLNTTMSLSYQARHSVGNAHFAGFIVMTAFDVSGS